MTASLYEQFFAVGSVKSLLTGRSVPKLPPPQENADAQTAADQSRKTGKEQ